MEINIIYLEDEMILSKEVFSDGWREIQEKYPKYKASLGPWDPEAVVDYIKEEYPMEWRKSKEKISYFLSGKDKVITL